MKEKVLHQDAWSGSFCHERTLVLFFMYTFSSRVTTSRDPQLEALECREKFTLVVTLRRTGPHPTQEKWEDLSTD